MANLQVRSRAIRLPGQPRIWGGEEVQHRSDSGGVDHGSADHLDHLDQGAVDQETKNDCDNNNRSNNRESDNQVNNTGSDLRQASPATATQILYGTKLRGS